MKKKIIYIIFAIAISSIIFIAGSYAEKTANFNALAEVYQLLKDNFIENIKDEDKLVYGAIKGMLEATDDPYTRFLEPKANSEMKTKLEGEFFGIGIQIGLKDNKLLVISPIEDTPAYRAGLKAQDQIVSIDYKSTQGISLEEAVSTIRGDKGKKVLIGIKRTIDKKDKFIDFPIIRDAIKLISIRDVEVISKNIGYFRLTSFESKNMFAEMTKAILDLDKKGTRGLIIDLRNNGGGLLNNAILASSIFLDNGQTIVHVVDKKKILDSKIAFNVGMKAKMPLVVLINGNSASASEIFAGAIADNERGVVIGSTSFGKASVQHLYELQDGSAVLMTVAKYLTPKKTDIAKKGITPKIEIEIPSANIEKMLKEDYEYSKEDDLVLQRAIVEIKKLLK